MDILEMLYSKEGFTGTEIKIADYVLEHSRQVSGMSANVLAKETFSSSASVIRMCRKMGFSGYREFQITLAARLSKRETDGKRADGYDFLSTDTVPGDVMKLLGRTVTDAVSNCLSHVSRESLCRASVWMSRANRLFIYGADYLGALAFCQMMSGLGIASTVPDLFSEGPAEKGKGLDGDVALFTGYSGDALPVLKKKMLFLRKRGCRVIVVSTESACPDADLFIGFPGNETNLPYAEMTYLQTAFLYIMSCMYCLTDKTKGLTDIERP